MSPLLNIVYRNLLKQKWLALVNVICLAAGLLVVFLTLLYVQHELSFDQFNSREDRIFRLITARSDRIGAIVPYRWGAVLKEQWPDVEKLATIQNITIALTVRKDGEVYAQHGVVGADEDLFDIFDFPVVAGDESRFLRTPDKMVITPDIARKYFGDADPLGQTLEISLWGTYVNYEIEGVVESPENSHLPFAILIPMQYVERYFFSSTAFSSWTTRFAYTYLLLKEDSIYRARPDLARDYLKQFLALNGGDTLSGLFSPQLQPLSEVYLTPNLEFDFPPRGNPVHIWILLVAGLGILFMAVINFVNITSALYLRRIKEVGLKMILGATRLQAVTQLLAESVALSLIALIVVLQLLSLLLPWFNSIAGTSFELDTVLRSSTGVGFLLIAIVTGIVAGLIPTLMLVGLRPETMIHAAAGRIRFGGKLRNYLVTLQFVCVVMLLLSSGVVSRQVRYLGNKDLGLNQSQVIAMQDVQVVASDLQQLERFRNALHATGQIRAVSASSSSPGQSSWSNGYLPSGYQGSEKLAVSTIYVDPYFASTYDLPIKYGRDFNPDILTDVDAVLINAAAQKYFASLDSAWLDEPLKQTLAHGDKVSPVIGVVDDFHVESPSREITPLVLAIEPESYFNIQIKVIGDSPMQALPVIETTWKSLFPDIPFAYTLIEQEFSRLNEPESKLSHILDAYSRISIVIAILGLLGISSLQALQMERAMSIRKVIGASELNIFILTASQSLRLVAAANLIAVPLAVLIMQRWLETFAYRTAFPVALIVLVVVLTLLVSLLTVCVHALRVARSNPVAILAAE